MLPDMLPEASKNNNPLLTRVVIPGETFTLPSRGLFYKDNELTPNVANGEIQVYPLTLIDEITLKSPDRLFSGDGIKEVFHKCIPDVLKPMELLSKDVDFLMACLRKVSFGPKIEIKVKHDCEHAAYHTYDINIAAMVSAAIKLDPTQVESDFKLSMPNGQVIHLQPSKFGESITTFHKSIEKKNATTEEPADPSIAEKMEETDYKDSLLSFISHVDDISDKEMISQWLSIIPTGWIRNEILPHITKLNDFGINFEAPYVCLDCQETSKEQINLNPMYFFS